MVYDSNNSVPTFIGAGATKSGSSWLFSILSNHDDVYAPFKEVRYFTHNLEKGANWYKSLFEGGADYKHCGEFTPSYLYNPDIPKIIAKEMPWVKLIFILRNPVRRSYSQFKSNFNTGLAKSKDFKIYLNENPLSLQRGYYYKHLQPWLEEFPSSQIKIFIFEEAISDLTSFRRELSEFLDLDVSGFSMEALNKKQNVSDAPRLKSIYKMGWRISQYAAKHQLYGVSKFINRSGSRFFSFIGPSKEGAPPLEQSHYDELIKLYESDISELSSLLGRDASIWN